MRRPLETLTGWRQRYGDAFSSVFLVFGTGVYVADPDAIRELFTGDQSDLHAGEANAPLAPVLGRNSVLILDGPEHLRQRKLLLPPFQGSAIAALPRGRSARWPRPRSRLAARRALRACASGCGR